MTISGPDVTNKMEILPCHVIRQANKQSRERSRQIKFLKYVLMGLMTMQEAARALGISLASLDRRRRDFLGDDQEDTDDIRKLTRARKIWRSDK
jgi:hypothetical protein